jgi:hypothetical protein
MHITQLALHNYICAPLERFSRALQRCHDIALARAADVDQPSPSVQVPTMEPSSRLVARLAARAGLAPLRPTLLSSFAPRRLLVPSWSICPLSSFSSSSSSSHPSSSSKEELEAAATDFNREMESVFGGRPGEGMGDEPSSPSRPWSSHASASRPVGNLLNQQMELQADKLQNGSPPAVPTTVYVDDRRDAADPAPAPARASAPAPLAVHVHLSGLTAEAIAALRGTGGGADSPLHLHVHVHVHGSSRPA